MSDHNKYPSSEKEHEKCIFRLSYFHRIKPNHIDVKTGDPSLHVVRPPVLPGVRGAGGDGEPGQVSCDWWVRGHVTGCSPLIGQARGPHPPRPAPRLPRRPRPLLLAAEAAARAAGPLLRGRGLPVRGRGGGGRVREEWGDQRGVHLPRR